MRLLPPSDKGTIFLNKGSNPDIRLYAIYLNYIIDRLFLIGVVGVFGGAMKAGAKTVKLEVDEVGPMGDGDTAYERSHYTFYDDKGGVFDHGK